MTDSCENRSDPTAILRDQGIFMQQPVPRLHVVLFEPEIAANTGAIGRTCVAVGARLWLVRPLGFHLDDRHLRRAGLDYWEHLELRWRTAWTKWQKAWAGTGFGRSAPRRTWFTRRRFSSSVTLWSSGPKVAAFQPRGWNSVRIDRYEFRSGPRRSLNLASAVAVALFEGVRQLGQKQAIELTGSGPDRAFSC